MSNVAIEMVKGRRIRGGVLPTVVVVSVVILIGMLGLLTLWEQENLLFARSGRLRQARADAESAYTLYRLHAWELVRGDSLAYVLYDSLPKSRIHLTVYPWGLYDAVRVVTDDSVVSVCRIYGAEPEEGQTLYYPGRRAPLSVAGNTLLRGNLFLPENGVMYARVGSDYYCGPDILPSRIRRAATVLPRPDSSAVCRVETLFARAGETGAVLPPDSLRCSFLHDTTAVLRVGDAELHGYTLRGNILLLADELRIDSLCRLENVLICARKITVGRGARIAAQLFARETVVVEPGVVMEYPSGLYAGEYAELGEGATLDGYVIVRDTARRTWVTANYRQSRTARLRGMLYVDGVAQVQGVLCGRALLRRAVYFSPEGYYEDMVYDLTLLENPLTGHPRWLAADKRERRKEVVCVD